LGDADEEGETEVRRAYWMNKYDLEHGHDDEKEEELWPCVAHMNWRPRISGKRTMHPSLTEAPALRILPSYETAVAR
jgi:hypothetical protein